MQTTESPWENPTYSPAEAARLVGLTSQRVRRWLHGYTYAYAPPGESSERRVRQAPVLAPVATQHSGYASFFDLIDLLFVKSFLDHGTSLQRLRIAFEEARTLTGSDHFAQRIFFTQGRDIFLRVPDQSSALMQLMSGGQWVIAPVIEAIAEQITFDENTGLAKRWYPLGSEKPVVLDPQISFGAPSVLGKGIETANIYDLYMAEHKNIDRVCSWMEIDASEATAAVEFEERLKAA